MSTVNAEVAPEALEKNLEQLKIVDEKSGESKNEKQGKRRFVRIPDEERRRQWEEEQKDKSIVETAVTGFVKWYSVLGHYGFISRDDGKKDVFVHQSAILKSHTIKFYLRTLADDEKVVFDVVEGKKGQEAANVTGPDGVEVKGSRFKNALFRRFPRRGRSKRDEDDMEENKEEAGGDIKKRGPRNRRSVKKDNNENGAEGKDEERKPRRRNRQRRHRRSQNGEKSSAEDVHSDSEVSQKPGARRRKESEKVEQSSERCGSALANGDASLGATAAEGQV